jgi:hypothetical protein
MGIVNPLYLVTDCSVLLFLFFYKTVHFYKCTGKRTWRRWFYFNKYSIINANSRAIQKLRIQQNRLSILILVLAFFSIIVLVLSKEIG